VRGRAIKYIEVSLLYKQLWILVTEPTLGTFAPTVEEITSGFPYPVNASTTVEHQKSHSTHSLAEIAIFDDISSRVRVALTKEDKRTDDTGYKESPYMQKCILDAICLDTHRL